MKERSSTCDINYSCCVLNEDILTDLSLSTVFQNFSSEHLSLDSSLERKFKIALIVQINHLDD